MKKPLKGIQTEMTSALPDDTSGLQFKKTVSFMKMMLRLVALSVFIIRVVMDYLFFCDSALLANTRQIEYAMVILWAGGMAAYAVLKMLSGKDSAVSRLGSLFKNTFRAEYCILLGIFVWGIVSCVSMGTAYKGNWVEANRYAMEDMAVSVLVFFPMPLLFDDEESLKVLRVCLNIMMTVITVLMAVVIWNVFHSKVIRLPDGLVFMRNNDELEISCNRNTVAAYAAFTAFLCPVMMLSGTRKWAKPLYIIAFIIHWVIQCLTQSTTGLLVGALSGGLMFTVFLMDRRKKGAFRRKILIASLCGAAVLIILWMSRTWIFRFYQVLTGSAADTLRDMSGNDNLSGRIGIWKAAVRAIFGYNGTRSTFRNALFGYTFAGVPSVIGAICGGQMYTHNQYLEIGAAMGIPALMGYIAFSVVLGIRGARILLAERGRVTLQERFIIILILSLVIGNLPEGRLIGNGYMTGCFFFLMCGWCSRRSRDLGKPSLSWKDLKGPENTQAQADDQTSLSVDTLSERD